MSQAKAEPDLGDYTDYLLLSSSALTQGWKHNIMRLAPASASDEASPARWAGAKLNRRDMRRIRREEEEMVRKAAEAAQAEEQAAAAGGEGAEPGSANDMVKKESGFEQLRPGMPGYSAAKAEPIKEERDDSLVAPGSAGTSTKVGSDGKTTTTINRPRRGFGAPKKTRRVFITEESAKERRIHFEEQHPWMLETSVDDKKSKGQTTRWLGKMDAAASAVANGGEGSSYVLLVLDNSPSSEAAFKVAPANRWYRFSSRPRYATMNGEEAEQEYQKMQKTGDMDLWFAQRRANLPSGSAASQQQMPGRMARGPDSFMSNGNGQSGGYKSRLALARGTEDTQSSSGGRRLKTVVNDDLRSDDFEAEDYEPAGPAGRRAGKAKVKPRKRAGLADDEYEEFDYEEDFQDDEEGIGQVGDEAIEDTDTKELEERIKKEMRGATFPGQGVEAADEDDEIGIRLTKAGKKVKKLLKKRGRKGRPEEEEDDLDEDDDEDDDMRNPYASEESEEDSDAERERLKKEAEKKKKQQYPGQVGFSANGTPAISRNNSSAPKYPGGSAPISRAPSTGPPGSRAASPSLASNGSLLKRATSPSASGSRAASPTPPPSASKRKAEEGGSPSASDADKATKRRKPGSPSPAPAVVPVAPGDDSALIPRTEIIAFIKEKMPSTKELLRHFKQAMARDSRNKNVILQVTKEVATISEGKLAVKPEFM